ncbi:MAG: DUF350 domain-containing protein [Aestuariibacter sp.]|nr:DUF350 domain-containing protein [Aestuariibacter sp.]|tara:strand:+ start:117860 stop:118273 length:414 start_codon:yes stop_codon:yes gene_type:complete
MELIQKSLAGLPHFALYFSVAIAMIVVFSFVYSRVTPYCEWTEIKKNHNTAASIAYVGAIAGFTIPLMSAMNNSVALADFVVWGIVACLVQLAVFTAIRLPLPDLVQRIKNQEVQAGIFLGGISVIIGLINASSMNG